MVACRLRESIFAVRENQSDVVIERGVHEH